MGTIDDILPIRTNRVIRGPIPMLNRAAFLTRVREHRQAWDIAVIGGGATGVGIAVDAASRGYETVLLEQSDFGKGTSSRSTKLVHGGVRYLRQGNVWLVREALRERGRLRRNAPHLVHDLEFVIPNYRWWERPFYGLGLALYDRLAGACGFGRSQTLSRAQVLERLPTLRPTGLRGGVKYHDGQFDDSRLLISLTQTAAEQGACLLNYARARELVKDSAGNVAGIRFREEESGEECLLTARCVINATGPFSDEIRRMDDPDSTSMISPSQGVHVVLPRALMPSDTALVVPRTDDGRVMFAIPWHDHVLVGTTDTPIPAVSLEPRPLETEIDFVLQTAAEYLLRPPTRADLLSVFAGIRPLPRGAEGTRTATLSRDHSLRVSKSGLLTVTGGKWTTYRRMAEDTVDRALVVADLPERPSPTSELRIHGYHEQAERFGALAVYGSDAERIQALMRERPELAASLHPALPICGAQVVWAARAEMARTVDDVLARRTRALFLNASAALDMAPAVARLLGDELGRDEAWRREQLNTFANTARHFLVTLEARTS